MKASLGSPQLVLPYCPGGSGNEALLFMVKLPFCAPQPHRDPTSCAVILPGKQSWNKMLKGLHRGPGTILSNLNVINLLILKTHDAPIL